MRLQLGDGDGRLASPPNGITNVAFDGASVWVLAGNDAIKL